MGGLEECIKSGASSCVYKRTTYLFIAKSVTIIQEIQRLTKTSLPSFSSSVPFQEMWGKDEEPKLKDVFEQQERRPSAVEAMSNQHRKSVSNQGLTGASALTVRQSIWPITLVTILFFLWGEPRLHNQI